MDMRKPTTLLRIHAPYDLVERLDRLAGDLSGEMKQQVPRAALVRAVILTQIDVVENREKLVNALDHDPVRRG